MTESKQTLIDVTKRTLATLIATNRHTQAYGAYGNFGAFHVSFMNVAEMDAFMARDTLDVNKVMFHNEQACKVFLGTESVLGAFALRPQAILVVDVQMDDSSTDGMRAIHHTSRDEPAVERHQFAIRTTDAQPPLLRTELPEAAMKRIIDEVYGDERAFRARSLFYVTVDDSVSIQYVDEEQFEKQVTDCDLLHQRFYSQRVPGEQLVCIDKGAGAFEVIVVAANAERNVK